MSTRITAEEVLAEIEFELMQSVVSSGEIGQAAQSVRSYQQQAWSEIAPQLSGLGDAGDAIRYLFRMNEMLVTLVEQVVSDARVLQAKSRKLERLVLSPQWTVASDTSDSAGSSSQGSADLESGVDENNGSRQLESIIRVSDMLDAVDQTPSALTMEVRSSSIPVFGALLSRMRMAIHNVAVFYVNRFARKQSRTNEAYRDLLRQLVAIAADQQEQIDVLRMQLRTRNRG